MVGTESAQGRCREARAPSTEHDPSLHTLPNTVSSPSALGLTLPDTLSGRGPAGSGYISRSILRAASLKSGVSATMGR